MLENRSAVSKTVVEAIMRALLLVALSVFPTIGVVMAQETPKGEMFVGYSYAKADFTGAGQQATSLNGWDASVAGNVSRWLGVVADFSGHYGSPQFQLPIPPGIPCPPDCLPALFLNTRAHECLFGPQLSYRTEKITPFAHSFFGASHVTESVSIPFPVPAPPISISTSQTGFAMVLGGGLDYNLTGRLAWRAQTDYLMTRLFNHTQNNFRFSTGIVFRF